MTTTEQTLVDVALVGMTYERMRPLLNDVFQLSDGQASCGEITLVEVEPKVEKKPVLHSWQKPKAEAIDENPAKRVPFVLVFRFPVEPELTQGTYYFTHPIEGAYEGVFLAPIAADEDGRYLEAVFN